MAVGFQHDRNWLFSGSEDGTAKIWDMRAPPRCQRTYEILSADGQPSACTSVTLHPNQGELITGDHTGLVRIWDLVADKCSAELRPTDGELSPIRSVAVASDGTCLVAGTNDVSLENTRVYDERTGCIGRPLRMEGIESEAIRA